MIDEANHSAHADEGPVERGLGVTAGDDELYGDAYPGERGNTRAPRFGEWLRGVWASAGNPTRDGMYVRTIRRTGRATNPGTWYELTDGKGKFWQYQAKDTVFVTPNARLTGPQRDDRPTTEGQDHG